MRAKSFCPELTDFRVFANFQLRTINECALLKKGSLQDFLKIHALRNAGTQRCSIQLQTVSVMRQEG